MQTDVLDLDRTHARIKRPFDRFLRFVFRASPQVVPAENGDRRDIDVRYVLGYFWQTVRAYPLTLATIILGVIVASSLGIITPLYYKDFFNGLSATTRTQEMVLTLSGILTSILLINVTIWGFWRAVWFGLSFLTANAKRDLQMFALGYTLRHSFRFFQKKHSGATAQEVNRFADAYDKLSHKILADILPIVIEVTFIIAVLIVQYPVMAGILFGWMCLLVTVNYLFAKWKLGYDVVRAKEDSKTRALLSDICINHSAIEAHATYDRETETYRKQIAKQMEYARFSWNLGIGIDTVQAFFVIGLEFAVFYLSLAPWQKGGMDVGMFVLIQTYLFHIAHRLWSFASVVRDIYDGFADAKEAAMTLGTPHEIVEPATPLRISRREGAVSVKDVSFSFTGRKVIAGISFAIRPGEHLALVGPSGSGKTTLSKLLYRIFDPDEGEVAIDGIDLRRMTLQDVREMVSVVPQDPPLFERTVLENIRYGRPGATESEVVDAAIKANCHDFIMDTEKGYLTAVGERGVKLSGGQRQRIVIARAFLRNAPILILDEATSSLDSESEERIQDALMKLMEGKTTIIIAHRLSTIRRMERILVMKDGRIVEDGSHDELFAQGGLYWKLWSLQQNGFIPEEL